jgi:hypothetical protein
MRSCSRAESTVAEVGERRWPPRLLFTGEREGLAPSKRRGEWASEAASWRQSHERGGGLPSRSCESRAEGALVDGRRPGSSYVTNVDAGVTEADLALASHAVGPRPVGGFHRGSRSGGRQRSGVRPIGKSERDRGRQRSRRNLVRWPKKPPAGGAAGGAADRSIHQDRAAPGNLRRLSPRRGRAMTVRERAEAGGSSSNDAPLERFRRWLESRTARRVLVSKIGCRHRGDASFSVSMAGREAGHGPGVV